MLSPFNVVYPYVHELFKDDSYVADTSALILSHEAFVDTNKGLTKNGEVIIPCTIKDVDDNTYIFTDGLGNEIAETVIEVNYGDGWVQIGAAGPFQKSDAVYSSGKKIIFVHLRIEDMLYNKSLCGSHSIDAHMFSLVYYERLEFLYNSRVGSTLITEDSTVVSYDSSTGVLELDTGTHTLIYTECCTLQENDIVPAMTFVDKPIEIVFDPPYVSVRLKREYSHLRRILRFDSNKKIELV